MPCSVRWSQTTPRSQQAEQGHLSFCAAYTSVQQYMHMGTSAYRTPLLTPACCLCCFEYRHDWKICPYAHPGEVARRRHPRGYTAVLCPAKTAVRTPVASKHMQRGLGRSHSRKHTRQHASSTGCTQHTCQAAASAAKPFSMVYHSSCSTHSTTYCCLPIPVSDAYTCRRHVPGGSSAHLHTTHVGITASCLLLYATWALVSTCSVGTACPAIGYTECTVLLDRALSTCTAPV